MFSICTIHENEMKNNNTLLSFLASDDAIIKSAKENKNNEKIFIFLGT